MAIFTVHVPSGGENMVDRADRTAFVRDGFSVPALLFGPLYFLQVRAWLTAVLWVAVVLAVAVALSALHMPWIIEAGAALLIVLFTGLEANSVRRLALHRRGFETVDVVEAPSHEEAERAFFRKATAEGGLPPRRTVRATAMRGDEPVIGFFSDPGLAP